MKRWYGLNDLEGLTTRPVVAIGVYDGVHRGHRKLIRKAVEDAASSGVESVVLTFDPNPAEVLGRGPAPTRLSVLAQRLELIESLGVDAALVMTFDEELSKQTPADFVHGVLGDALNASQVVVGENFRFGHRAAGDVSDLRELGRDRGLKVDPVPLLVQELIGRDNLPLSSTEIRGLVAAGDVAAACRGLARPHRVEGVVVQGDRRGAELGFPTANLEPTDLAAIPAEGVYAGRLVDSPHGDQRRTFPAAISIGTNPTFDGQEQTVEAYAIADEALRLYDHQVAVEFIDRVREQQRFASTEQLVNAMHNDVARVRHVLGLGS